MPSFKIALLCGGPSLERGISLNSARSLCDHLQSEQVEILPLYFDHKKNPYLISRSQLYSNTPSDFDFKLHNSAKPLSANGLKKFLKTVDIAFPAMHGSFGEDGEIQKILEKHKCPYVGSPVEACKKAFDKYEANEFIARNGFFTLPSVVLKSHEKNHKKTLSDFFLKHRIKRAVVKPATGGSSIGVFSVSMVEEALKKAKNIFSKRMDTRVVVEPFCEGKEFTVIILQNRFDLPVAILPTEIEMNYDQHQLFDYRRKYLATNRVTYHCPPRFSDDIVEKIQTQAEQLFQLLGMRDFARFDGWLLPDGNIWFSDFNPISGMEQNSFLFMQSSRIGMSHRDLLRYILKNACKRYGLTFPDERVEKKAKKPVHVLFGGNTAERQVSLMSGTNVWLKLRRSKKYEPIPYLLDPDLNVWRLPYSMLLNHTVEEIIATCSSAKKDDTRLHNLQKRVYEKLNLEANSATEPFFFPEKMSLKEFIKRSKYVFIALHGGIGENGELQKMFEKENILYNGSDSKTSRLCMDKYETAIVLKPLEKEGILTAKKKILSTKDLSRFTSLNYLRLWKKLQEELESQTAIVKPVGDGCSAGIARLFRAKDLQTYMRFALQNAPFIPEGQLSGQHGIIEMPTEALKRVMVEQFITTDKVQVVQDTLKWETRSGWVEVTIGVLEEKGKLHVLNPSLTVASGNVLSLEEKFQGGTGINITPPPSECIKPTVLQKVKERIEKVAVNLGIKDYARIDAFMHIKTGEVIIIEANTLPGLTPSTVIYHQALAENPPLYPTEFLERIIEGKGEK